MKLIHVPRALTLATLRNVKMHFVTNDGPAFGVDLVLNNLWLVPAALWGAVVLLAATVAALMYWRGATFQRDEEAEKHEELFRAHGHQLSDAYTRLVRTRYPLPWSSHRAASTRAVVRSLRAVQREGARCATDADCRGVLWNTSALADQRLDRVVRYPVSVPLHCDRRSDNENDYEGSQLSATLGTCRMRA